MYVSSGELLEHPNPAEQSLFLFRTKGERPAIIGLKVASLETLSAANSQMTACQPLSPKTKNISTGRARQEANVWRSPQVPAHAL
jgi:hypothetical protein